MNKKRQDTWHHECLCESRATSAKVLGGVKEIASARPPGLRAAANVARKWSAAPILLEVLHHPSIFRQRNQVAKTKSRLPLGGNVIILWRQKRVAHVPSSPRPRKQSATGISASNRRSPGSTKPNSLLL